MISSSPSYKRVASRLLGELPASLRASGENRILKFSTWMGDEAIYVNRETGHLYKPHNQDEIDFISSDTPRRWLLKGGEGSGKSVAGIIKTLERLRRGMSGIMGSPDFVHFRKSLWAEFCRWCPPNALVPKHRYRLEPDWEPTQPFKLVFVNSTTLLCGGFDRPGSWEGPNVTFAHFDEARHHPTSSMIKVLDGRCRIAGPTGELPQWWLTTTPRKSLMSGSPDGDQFHWLYTMFGPWGDPSKPDPFSEFKASSRVITLRLDENTENLAEGYVRDRKQSLTDTESSILVDAEWSDEETNQRFLPTMAWWDRCREYLPPIGNREPMIIALDAATGRASATSDCFGILGVTRHPNDRERVAVRLVEEWHAKPGHAIDFVGTEDEPGPETFLRRALREYNVVCVVFDPHQLVSLAQRVEVEEGVWFDAFGQIEKRLKSDKALLDHIIDRTLVQNGDYKLRAHIDAADRKVDEIGSRFRIVKGGRGPVDLAVCLSMATWQCLDLNI